MTPHQSGYDALADSTVEADLGLSTPNDSMPCQQGTDEGTTNYTPDHIFAWKNPSVLIDQTKSSEDGLKTAHTYLGANKESGATETSTKVKMEDLSQFMYDTRSTFLAPNSSTNEPIIVSDESDAEEDADTNTGTYDTSHAKPKKASALHPSSLKSVQLQELKDQVLKDLPSKITNLSGELQELKKHVQGMEIKLPRELKDILTKIKAFTSTVSGLTS
nr:hypothetical protein [Tanacetum cinerariifolium]